jgi:hypothetical protein
MAWRVAHSLLVLRAEVNALAPNRSKVSDGTIGDAAHASRNSDHNPYVKDARGVGVVRALDITHDPAGGCDAHAIAEHIRLLGKAGDPRVRYVISNARIASATQNWAWRPYNGPNAHRSHAHTSVVEGIAYDSNAPWGLADVTVSPISGVEPVAVITNPEDDLMITTKTPPSPYVEHVQRLINGVNGRSARRGDFPAVESLKADGRYGPKTIEAAAHALGRAKHYLTIDLASDPAEVLTPAEVAVLAQAVVRLGDLGPADPVAAAA